MNDWADTIEWWENDQGVFNWHAISDENGQIIFGSVQGYADKGTMLRYVSQQFPHLTIRPRDGEPEPSTITAQRENEETTAALMRGEDLGTQDPGKE